MRVSSSVAFGAGVVNNAQVLASPEHRGTLGLAWVGTGCLIVDRLDEVDWADSDRPSVAILDPRPEDAVSSLAAVLRSRDDDRDWSGHLVTDALGLPSYLSCLLRHADTDGASLSTIAIADGLAVLTLEASAPDSSSGAQLLAGLSLAQLTSAEPTRHRDVERVSSNAQGNARLASALALIADLTTPQPAVQKEPEPESGSAVTAAEKAQLEGRITTLSVELSALQRKYDALASSRLGRLTLAMWARKRGSE